MKPGIRFLIIFILHQVISASGTIILQNPSPVPQGTMAEFVCNATSVGLTWIHSAAGTSEPPVTNPGGNTTRSTRLLVPAILVNNNTIIKCQTFEQRSSTAQFFIYGPPSEPVGLSSELSPVAGELMLSWSPPWAPDGVQLHYAVTVTNTNSTSTTTITMFNTSSTNITVDRQSITKRNSTECDYYTFSVTAINPAGSSFPTNSTTPVSFVTAPDVNVSTSINGSTLYIVVLQSATDFSTINVSVELVNSCVDEMPYTDEMPLVGDDSWSFNITDPQNWTSITVIAVNQCRNISVPVNFTALVCPNTDAATTITTPTAHTMTATSLLPSSTDTMTMSQPVWGITLAILGALVVLVTVPVTITIFVGYCLWRKKQNKTCYNSSVKPIESTSDEKLIDSFKQDKSAPQTVPMSAGNSTLPEYMTPADARKEVKLLGKEVKLLGKQQGSTSKSSTLNSGLAQPMSPEYAQPSAVVNHKPVVDTAMYSDVWQNKTNSLPGASQTRSINKPHAAPSLPPPPPTATDEYSSLQHNLGGGGGPQQHQVVDQDQHVYDSAQGDLPQYSTIAQQKKTKYADVEFSPDTGLEIRGNTSSTVQYSVVGDTTNMEYSVVGPKTASSQDCPPPPPPPPSADVVRDLMNN